MYGTPLALRPSFAGMLTRAPTDAARLHGQMMDRFSQREIRGPVCVIPVAGMIMNRASFYTFLGFARSLDDVMDDVQAALDDRQVEAILLAVDSPGGIATGVAEAFSFIKQAAGQKPIWAHCDYACSAGYWLACGASEIWSGRGAEVGSVGVVVDYPKQVQPDMWGDMYHTITSSNADNKRPDPSTEEGRAVIRKELDALEDVFIGDVATARGVSREQIVERLGNGGTVIGAAALAAGAVDQIGSFEECLAALTASLSAADSGTTPRNKGDRSMSGNEPGADTPKNKAKAPEQSTAVTTPEPEAGPKPASFETIAAIGKEARLDLDMVCAMVEQGLTEDQARQQANAVGAARAKVKAAANAMRTQLGDEGIAQLTGIADRMALAGNGADLPNLLNLMQTSIDATNQITTTLAGTPAKEANPLQKDAEERAERANATKKRK